MDEPALRMRPARPGDGHAVVALVNGAYRDATGRGWTTEVGLIGGPRTDEAGFRALDRPGSVVLVAERADRLVGCVHLTRGEGGECFLGMLSVRVTEQASGVGRAILSEAEAYARRHFGATFMAMRVVSVRHELIAWYERRGYRRTGRRVPFQPGDGERLLAGPLEFVELEKRLA